jgi:hypothetical protein
MKYFWGKALSDNGQSKAPSPLRSAGALHKLSLMKRYLAIFCWFVGVAGLATAQDVTKLEKIGSVVSFTKSEKAVVLNCQDNSQVQLTILAPDLVRVRVSFGKPIPPKDHSWAIAKTEWATPRWSFSEPGAAVLVTTDELEVLVQLSPLLIEFRDA